jgi:erythromycin esterase-like protein
MFETLQRLMAFKKNAKAVVWAHKSHLGGARYTSMGRWNGEINLGQLCRQNFGQVVAIVGRETHTGTVAGAHEWDEPMVVMNVNPSQSDSYEWLAHEAGLERFLLDLRRGECDESLREELRKERLERFIGVIYLPEAERQSHYSHAMLAEQFDAYLWFDNTKA